MKKLPLVTSVLFCFVLFGFGIWFWVLPDKDISSEENRPLQGLPTFTLSRLASGKFSSDLSTYYADQFPLRDGFVGIKALAELSLGKGENDGILLGKNGQLSRRLFRLAPSYGALSAPTDAFSEEGLSYKIKAIKKLSITLDIPFTLLLPGRALDIASSAFSYPNEGSEALLEELRQELSEFGYGDLNEKLRAAYERGEPVWYATDHHWTTLGAYYAYCEVLSVFGMEEEILPLSGFERKVVSTSFYGTLYSASGMKFLSPDQVELFLSGHEEDYTVVADGKELPGLYNDHALEGKDHYAIFLDGTHDVVEIFRKDGVKRPLLLAAKDSFANSLAPFLVEHFDLVFLNLSSAKTDFADISAAVEAYRPQKVLLVYSVENLLTSDKLLGLR